MSELLIVNDLHERKRMMIEEVDAVIALPGGCGTLEELFEAITWKRLGLFAGPIVLVNTLDFYTPCVKFLESCIERRFMDERHRKMWSLVERPEDVLGAIADAKVFGPKLSPYIVTGGQPVITAWTALMSMETCVAAACAGGELAS